MNISRRWNGRDQEDSSEPYAWLYRIVLDCLIESWRRQSRGKRDLRKTIPWPEQSSVQLGLSLIAKDTSPSAAAQRKELHAQVHDLMRCLSERDQEILWMRHFDQLSFGEIAFILELTENAATVRYARAVRRLRDVWLLEQKRANP